MVSKKKQDLLEQQGYTLEGELGHGGFSEVYLYKKEDKKYAAKFFHASDKGYNSYINEMKHILKLDHPHIVKVISSQQRTYGIHNENQTGIMIMEYCEGLVN